MCNTEELYVKELEQVQTKTYHDSPRKARTRLSMSRVMVGRIFHAFVNVESMLGSFLFAAVWRVDCWVERLAVRNNAAEILWSPHGRRC